MQRPVKNGRVVARIVAGHDVQNNWCWEAATEIADDGTFVLQSLPADENLQLIAICDGWVSSNPAEKEITEFEKRWNFGPQPDGAYQVTATLEQGSSVLDQRVAGVRIGAAPKAKGRGILLVIAGLLLLIIIALILWFVFKRSRRDDEVAPAAT